MYYYFDANVQVKYFTPEPGTSWVRQLVDGRTPEAHEKTHVLFTATVTIAETAAAFSVIARAGRISRRIRDRIFDLFVKSVLSDYHLIPVTLNIVNTAAHLTQRYPLKGYDAIQLASGLYVESLLSPQQVPFVFVSGDNAVVAAAQAEGLTVDNPFWHADLDSGK